MDNIWGAIDVEIIGYGFVIDHDTEILAWQIAMAELLTISHDLGQRPAIKLPEIGNGR